MKHSPPMAELRLIPVIRDDWFRAQKQTSVQASAPLRPAVSCPAKVRESPVAFLDDGYLIVALGLVALH